MRERFNGANRWLMFKAALAFAEVEYGARAVTMPGIGRTRTKTKKAVFQPERIAQLVAAAQTEERGI